MCQVPVHPHTGGTPSVLDNGGWRPRADQLSHSRNDQASLRLVVPKNLASCSSWKHRGPVTPIHPFRNRLTAKRRGHGGFRFSTTSTWPLAKCAGTANILWKCSKYKSLHGMKPLRAQTCRTKEVRTPFRPGSHFRSLHSGLLMRVGVLHDSSGSTRPHTDAATTLQVCILVEYSVTLAVLDLHCARKRNTIETSLRWQNERLVVCQMSRNTVPPEHQDTFRVPVFIKALSMFISLLNDNSWITCVANGMRPGSRTLRCLSNKLKRHTVTTPNAQNVLVLRRALRFNNRLQASRARESDVLSLLQRHAALMRHEPLGRKYMKSNHAVKNPVGRRFWNPVQPRRKNGLTYCVKKSIQASWHLGIFGRCVIQGERLWMLLYSKKLQVSKDRGRESLRAAELRTILCHTIHQTVRVRNAVDRSPPARVVFVTSPQPSFSTRPGSSHTIHCLGNYPVYWDEKHIGSSRNKPKHL